MLNIALPKGRLGEKVYNMFEQAGFECPSIKELLQAGGAETKSRQHMDRSSGYPMHAGILCPTP